MAEANADNAGLSSQNSADGSGLQQTREKKFFDLYDNHVEGKETHILTATQYNAVVDVILRCQRGEPVTNQKEYIWSKRFAMHLENGQNVLYRKGGKVIVRHGLFKLIQTAHHQTVHGGRDVTYREVSSYSGISKEIISLHLSLCRECELKMAKVRKSVVVKPLLSEDFNSRCQVDLIDLQSRPDGGYSFLMVYQDHLAKALERKTAIAVAEKLTEIFAVFGAPRILQSDNGKEFANQVVKELVRQWPECRNEEHLEPEPFVELNGEDWVTDVEDRHIPSEDKENSSADWSV